MNSLTLPTFDLVSESWSNVIVTYRNTLLGYLYPDTDFAIGSVQSAESDASQLAKLLDNGFEDYRIVGASGSRKSGKCIFAKGGGDYFTRFFGSNMNAINYGSNLTTECKKIVELPVNLLVVKDGEWGTGDCHGKASSRLCHEMVESIATPWQFRACNAIDNWIAKGTIAYSYKVSRSKYDLVLPESAFKGNKISAGECNLLSLILGLVFASPKNTLTDGRRNDCRIVKASYSVLQFFPWEVVEADILPSARNRARTLAALENSPRKIADYLLKIYESDSDDDDDDQYIPALAKLMDADKHGQLISHPYVVDRITALLRKRWVNLSTTGGLRFFSSMAMPDESIPDDHCCIPGLPDDEKVIVFPYPCRWKYDIKIWTNVCHESWDNSEGVIVQNTLTALKLSRDHDGDMIQWIPVSRLPNVAKAITEWGEPPMDQAGIKPKKVALQGSLGEIAVMSMSNDTGLITWLIAKSWALGKEDYVNQLVPQLQAAVDSLKGAMPPDQKLINKISRSVQGQDISWLTNHKVICDQIPEDGRTDTISLLVAEINKFRVAPGFRTIKLSAFLPMFDTPDIRWIERATKRIDEYKKDMASLYSSGCASHTDTLSIQDKYQRMLSNIPDTQRHTVAAAFWHSAHSKTTGTASICFALFCDEICEALQTLRLTQMRLIGRKDSDYSDRIFDGERIALQLVEKAGSKYAVAIDNHSKVLGFLAESDCAFPKDGWIDVLFEGLAYTRFDKNGRAAYTEVLALDDF